MGERKEDEAYKLRANLAALSESKRRDMRDIYDRYDRENNVGGSEHSIRQVSNLYDAVEDATKHDYGMRLLDKKARSMNIHIPEDVMKYKIADFLTPTKFGEPTAPLEILAATRNAVTSNPPVNAEQLRSALRYPDIYDRANFDILNVDPGFGYNFQNAFANLNRNRQVENEEKM
jgi:hypothetical protein